MNNRENIFRQKFSDASKFLDTSFEELASLKIRDVVRDYHEYQELLHVLEHEVGVQSSKIQGQFQGNGYLVQNSKTKIIIVEHETGLEILYIAGSIASLIQLIPLVLRCWSFIRGHGNRHSRPPEFHRIETRQFNSDGRLIEDRSNGMGVPWTEPLSIMNTALLSAVENIDIEFNGLKKLVMKLEDRLKKLEKEIKPKKKTVKMPKIKKTK